MDRPNNGRRVHHTNRFTGEREGRETQYWQNTRIKAFEVRNGGDEVVGVATSWHQDGTVRWQTRASAGGRREVHSEPPWWDGTTDQVVTDDPNAAMDDVVQPHGVFRAYHYDTTVLHWERIYAHGEANGAWTTWSPSGRITEQVIHTPGEPPRTRTEPPWVSAEDQVLEGRIVYCDVGLELARELIGDDAEVLLSSFGKHIDLAIAHFEEGQLHGPLLLHIAGRRLYAGLARRGKPIGAHTAWYLQDRAKIAWQRVYGATESTVIERDYLPPIGGAPLLDYRKDRVHGTGGPRRVRPPLRHRGDGPPVWFYGWSRRVDVGEGRLVDGRRHGLWTFRTSSNLQRMPFAQVPDDRPLPVVLQRRYEHGRLVDQRENPPWWP